MSPAPRWPTLFVVGAPKCGTTAVTRYLEAHPGCFMARRKDLHHFGADLDFRLQDGSRRPRSTPEAYRAHWAEAPDGALWAESSVWTLASTTAAAEIAATVPGARAVVLLRHPVDAMFALWTQLRLNGLGDEDVDDFEAALALEPLRAQGQRLPPGTPLPSALLYRQAVRFGAQLGRLQAALGPDHVHIIIQEEMRTDTAAAVRALYAFAGLDPDFVPPLRAVNTHKEVRSEGLRRLLRWMPAALKDALPGALRAPLRRLLRKANSTHAARPPMPPALRARLCAELAPEIAAVEAALGRPVPAWHRAG